MTVYRISSLIHIARRECSATGMGMSLRRMLKISMRQRAARNYTSDSSTSPKQNTSWHSFMTRWTLTVPIGVGVSLLAVLQWRHLRKYPYSAETAEAHASLGNFMIKFYYYLPLRMASRVCGWIASIEVPVSLRPVLYGFYAKTFHANLDEIDIGLTEFPSLVDFFVRPLKPNVRPIDQTANIVSPSDGKILHAGPVTSCHVEQVKGVTYNLRHFLGDVNSTLPCPAKKFTKEDDEIYMKTLLKNPANQLYQISVYLAPGDYHRFHSSSDWEIEYRRHFQGKLFSVNPRIARLLPDLFSLNERVVYIGKWAGGFMAYTAVGATNVGSIKVYCDKELRTNKIKWLESKPWKNTDLDCARVSKGELFGEFRMGSTIVLLFEAPKDFEFSVSVGEQIKVGQALGIGHSKDEKIVMGRSL